jgi:wobble nucleotide-excising tRNase
LGEGSVPTPVIASIKVLKNAATFLELPPPAEGISFLRYNLIYGFNGSGKTTLSRLIEAARIGGDCENLSDGCECTFVLVDGEKVSLSDDPANTAIGSRIAVFNEDFIERSLTWKSGAARPIVYIGEQQAEVAQRISASEVELEKLRADDELRAAEWTNATRSLSSLKTNLARLIASDLGNLRGYTALQLKNDFDIRDYRMDERLSDEKIAEFKEIISRTDIGNSVNLPCVPDVLERIASLASKCLSETVEQIAVDSLQKRPDALPWIRVGVGLHEHESDCLFCGQVMPSARIGLLREALGDSFDRLAADIEATRNEIRSALHGLSTFRESLPSTFADALPNFRRDLEAGVLTARDYTVSVETVLNRWNDQLSEKSSKSNAVILLDQRSGDVDSGLASQIQASIDDVVGRHNAEITDYSQLREKAKAMLKAHHLAGSQLEYKEAVQLETSSKETTDAARAKLGQSGAQLQALRAELKEHAPAAGQLNKLLKSYLGHDHVKLRVIDDGYQICRGDKVATKPLSEGEKTAIAFCYFITSLTSEGRKVEDLIVVVDDPISSLDTRAMTYVFALIKSRLDEAAQLFILTHNLDFLRENKKWLNKRFRHETDKTAEFLFVERFSEKDGSIRARIIPLPSLISEYDSEYHYLYSLIHGLIEKPGDFGKFQYLMPNAIRKVLEIFLAFKIPGSAGLGDKVNQVLRKYPDLDDCRVRSMEHLAQLESHSDSIGDTITFSGFTLEQVREGASTLLDMIGIMDESHRADMDRLARRANA